MLTLPSTVITMPFARVDAYMELLDEHNISKPNLFEFMLYDKIADLKFFGDMAISSATGIWNEVDEKIINGTTEERAEVGGEVFFNAILAALAWEWASGKKNAKVSNENLADDINSLEKPESNVVDDIVDKVDDVSKCADDVVEGGLDANLLDEMANSGAKYNPDDIVAITKTADGKLVWLENGTDTAGLNHIITEHADDFLYKGITKEQIPEYVMNALENGKIVGYQGRGTGRPIYEFTYNGEIHKVAITVGDNGFVVGANPK